METADLRAQTLCRLYREFLRWKSHRRLYRRSRQRYNGISRGHESKTESTTLGVARVGRRRKLRSQQRSRESKEVGD